MTITTGVFKNLRIAEQAITELRDNNVPIGDISCVYVDKDGDVKDSHAGEKMGNGAVKGAGTGAFIGTIAGLVVANGILPGLGTLFVAGPLATTLGLTGAAATAVAGAATGAVAGGLIGALSGLGVSEEDAQMYENQIRKGRVLVIANTDPEEVDAVDIFKEFGATEVREYETIEG